MMKNAPLDTQEFHLDLTHDKKDELSRDYGFGCDILQYSNDDTANEQYLKEIKEEEREEELRKQKREQELAMIISKHSNPSSATEERKRQRKAIFDKYRKKEQPQVVPDNNIALVFDEIFKRKNDRHQEGTVVKDDHIQFHPFTPLVHPDEHSQQRRQRPHSKIFSPQPAHQTEDDCSLVVSDGNHVDRNLMEAMTAVHSDNNLPSPSLADSNVAGNPQNDVSDVITDEKAGEQQASIHISGIRGQASNDALDASQEPSKEMLQEIENLLHQNIFADVSMMDSVNHTNHNIELPKVPEPVNSSETKEAADLPIHSVVQANEPAPAPATSELLERANSLPIHSEVDTSPHLRHAVSSKMRTATIMKEHEVFEFLNGDAVHPVHVSTKEIDQFLKDSPEKKHQPAAPVAQVSQVFDCEPETNSKPLSPKLDIKDVPDLDSDEEEEIFVSGEPTGTEQNQPRIAVEPNQIVPSQPYKPVRNEQLNMFANQPPTINKINELLLQRIVQVVNQQPPVANIVAPQIQNSPPSQPPFQPVTNSLPQSPLLVQRAPSSPDQQPSLSPMMQLYATQQHIVPHIQPLEQPNPSLPLQKHNHSFGELRDLGNNPNHSDLAYVEAQGNAMVCELLREAHRLNAFTVNLKLPNAHFLSPKCKDNLRRLIFELNLAGQTLWVFNEELYARELLQTKLYSAFQPEVFVKGSWLRAPSRPLSTIRPGDLNQQKQRKLGDYPRARACLINAAEVIKKLSDSLDALQIDPYSPDSMSKYSAVRKALDDITGNLIRISEDLYVKSSLKFLPEHYFTFYEYLSSGGAAPRFADPRALLKHREDMLAQLTYLRDQLDPLCTSSIGSQLFNRLHTDIRKIRTDYFGRPSTPSV